MRKSFNSVRHYQRDRKIQDGKPQTDLVCAVCQALLQGEVDLLYISGSWEREVTTLPYFREVSHVTGEKVAKITAICFKDRSCCQIKGVCRANGGGGLTGYLLWRSSCLSKKLQEEQRHSERRQQYWSSKGSSDKITRKIRENTAGGDHELPGHSLHYFRAHRNRT